MNDPTIKNSNSSLQIVSCKLRSILIFTILFCYLKSLAHSKLLIQKGIYFSNVVEMGDCFVQYGIVEN